MRETEPHVLAGTQMAAQLDAWIEYYCRQYDLPASFVHAIAQVESAGSIYAWRVEPHYRYLVNVNSHRPFRQLTRAEIASQRAPSDFPFLWRISSRDTEWWGQQSSWGALQVMGAVAREYGYTEAFPALCGAAGIKYGCFHLDRLRTRFARNHGWRGIAAAFNAGSPRYVGDGTEFVNQVYVDKVAKAGGFDEL